ncbi:Hypothetical protein CINCED_3A015640 [Cinara cedri]|uniref:Uncharacterized protein n=1 Tax=Cinara cedri TaxID=506608 RepID=A0A5E4LXV2_9HEMI|nr:Hypothetical protein CINCED_3A015640 [Cinara cedri]
MESPTRGNGTRTVHRPLPAESPSSSPAASHAGPFRVGRAFSPSSPLTASPAPRASAAVLGIQFPVASELFSVPLRARFRPRLFTATLPRIPDSALPQLESHPGLFSRIPRTAEAALKPRLRRSSVITDTRFHFCLSSGRRSPFREPIARLFRTFSYRSCETCTSVAKMRFYFTGSERRYGTVEIYRCGRAFSADK